MALRREPVLQSLYARLAEPGRESGLGEGDRRVVVVGDGEDGQLVDVLLVREQAVQQQLVGGASGVVGEQQVGRRGDSTGRFRRAPSAMSAVPAGFPPVNRWMADGSRGGNGTGSATRVGVGVGVGADNGTGIGIGIGVGCSASQAVSKTCRVSSGDRGGNGTSRACDDGVPPGVQPSARVASGRVRRAALRRAGWPCPRSPAKNATWSALPSARSRSTDSISRRPAASCTLSSRITGRPARCARGTTPAYASSRSASSARTRWCSAWVRALPPALKCRERSTRPSFGLPAACGWSRYQTAPRRSRRCEDDMPSLNASSAASMIASTTGCPWTDIDDTSRATVFPTHRPASQPPVSLSSRTRSASVQIRDSPRSPQPPAATASSPHASRGNVIRPAPPTGSASCSAIADSAS